MTPFEAWTGVKPNVSHLRSFACTVYAHIPIDERRKLDTKVEEMHTPWLWNRNKGISFVRSSKFMGYVQLQC